MKTRASFFVCIILLGLTACKKSAPKSSKSCRIIAIMDTSTYNGVVSTDVEFLFYDSAGRLSKYQAMDSAGTKTTVYSYQGNLLIRTPDNPGYEPSDSIYFNEKGLPYRLIMNLAGQIYDNRTFSYDASGQLQSEIFAENNGRFNVYSVEYEYSGGDLIKQNFNGTITNYTYYTDKPVADGDATRIAELKAYGIWFTRSAHLLKSERSANFSSEFTYTFDQSGKITSCTRVSATSTETQTYEYDCAR